MNKEKILIIGAKGQIGTELTTALRERYGWHNIVATDIHPVADTIQNEGIYLELDVLNKKMLSSLTSNYGITQIYHLAAVLSANGEQEPVKAWHINMQGLLNVLEVAREHQISQVFWPSSIAVFGKNAEFNPATVYGISKAAGEYWCQYYFEKYGLDVRSLRYPGLISYQTKPGGGTTDYAVEIFHQAMSEGRYTCFLKENTTLPMLYMPDAIRATLTLMEAPRENIKTRTSYNLAAFSFSPAELARAIKAHLPRFRISYQPDFRQAIADSWPSGIDDRQARQDWSWQERYDLAAMTEDMIKHLQQPAHV